VTAATAGRGDRAGGTRGLRWLLFAGLALVCPVPFLLLGPGLVPAARMAELAALTGAVILTESGRGVAPAILGVFAGQALLWLALSWLAAGLAARGLGRLGARRARALALGLVAAGVLAAASLEVYRTPFGTRARATLWEVYR
jgi:hypothetical protein